MNFQRTGKCMRNMPAWASSSYPDRAYSRAIGNDNFGYESTETRCARNKDNIAPQVVLAMVYAPYQTWKDIYDPATALCKGTIFEELNKPFCPCKAKEVK